LHLMPEALERLRPESVFSIVLIYAGVERRKALLLNFLVALTVILGGVMGYFLASGVGPLKTYLLTFAAGGFLYISASDLIPEIRKEQKLQKSLFSFGCFILGIGLMYFLKNI